jgi:hypothetical protein
MCIKKWALCRLDRVDARPAGKAEAQILRFAQDDLRAGALRSIRRLLLLFVRQQPERLHRARQPVSRVGQLIGGGRDLLRRGTLLFVRGRVAARASTPRTVVVNIGDASVLTLSPAGQLLEMETAAQAGNDGLVIMPDGTTYVSSVVDGRVSRMRPGQPAELIAKNIPNPASMCYDAGANHLVIPMNPNNGLASVPLR